MKACDTLDVLISLKLPKGCLYPTGLQSLPMYPDREIIRIFFFISSDVVLFTLSLFVYESCNSSSCNDYIVIVLNIRAK